MTQVENLTRKAQLQEIELERTTKQLKEAIAVAGEETAKCKAAKEVIKSLTSQVDVYFPKNFCYAMKLHYISVSLSVLIDFNMEKR